MSAIRLALDRELPGEADAADFIGKALGHSLARLDALAERTGVTKFGTFIDARSVLNEVIAKAKVAPEHLPPPRWYAPAEGLNALHALRQAIGSHPETLDGTADTLQEIQAMESILQAAQRHGARFHLLVEVRDGHP